MSRLVPPKKLATIGFNCSPVICQEQFGIMKMMVRKAAPAKVRRVMVKSRKEAVGLPGRTPGM